MTVGSESPVREDRELALLTQLGLSVTDRAREALTHPSYANEHPDARDYQRLEFLGDAVLGLCVSEALHERFPQAAEGQLTRMRASLVNADALAGWAEQVGLAGAMRLGRGVRQESVSPNVLADAVEALIAASYLDDGLEAARALCEKVTGAGLERLGDGAPTDAKSALQERVQATRRPVPKYRMVDRGGAPNEAWFEAEVEVDGEPRGRGRGKSKRQAEQAAARAALETLEAWLRPDGTDAEGPPEATPGPDSSVDVRTKSTEDDSGGVES